MGVPFEVTPCAPGGAQKAPGWTTRAVVGGVLGTCVVGADVVGAGAGLGAPLGAGPDAAGQVMILIWDAVAEPPVPQEAGAEDVSGRGLGIVDWLSGRQWDWYRPPAPYGGKVTEALIDRPWRDQPPAA